LESEKLYPKTAYNWDVFSKTDFENYSLLMRARESRSKKDILARSSDANNFEATSNLQGASVILKPTTQNLPTAHVTLVEGHKIYYKAVTDSSASAFDDSSKGQLIHVGLEQEISVQDSKWTLGASHVNESLDGFFVLGYGPMVPAKNTRSHQEINGLYSLLETPWTEELVSLVGIRHEKYLSLGEKTSSQVGLRWGAFKLEYAQGFKSPSLGQLTNMLYGNPNLKPESSRTVSAEYLWQSENTSLSLSPFWSEFEDLISPSGNPLRYYNVAETEIWGSEAGLRWQGQATTAGLNLTYQVPRERGSKDWLPRRPFWLGGLYVNTQLTDKTELGVDLNALGKRDDQLQNGGRIQLRDNYIWNWALNHTWTENLTVSLKMRNLFHDRYQESSGYLAEGRIYLVGLQWEN
jgi:vitamin B12 transporter